TTAATRSRSPLAGFVDRQRPATHVETIESLNRRIHALLGFHFHKAEAARPAGLPVGNHFGGANRAMLGKHLFQIGRRSRPRQVPHINLLRHRTPFLAWEPIEQSNELNRAAGEHGSPMSHAAEPANHVVYRFRERRRNTCRGHLWIFWES